MTVAFPFLELIMQFPRPSPTAFFFLLVVPIGVASAIDDFERPPINYSEASPSNSVTSLVDRIEAGEVTLPFDEQYGYLQGILRELHIPVESQVLVFSKTSLQMRRISPRTPRAIYFNDDVYVGYCQFGDVLELAVADAQLGGVFYTVDQRSPDKPVISRRTDDCLVCHSSSRTENVPGFLVRSLYVDTGGTPILSAGSRITDHRTPLDSRWGGWYVTGTSGSQKHLGNLIIRGRRVTEPVDNSAGINVMNLAGRTDVDRYLSPHSDIVALMVLEHQVLVHNRMTKANFATRQALAYEEMINRELGEAPGTRLDSTTRRIRSACDDLIDALLLVDEAPLSEPIRGTSEFAAQFQRAGPHDSKGRSLRQLDLKTRLLRYPCSYLIYSPTFDGLPDEAKSYVWRRLREILSGKDSSKRFAHLSAADRKAIMEILSETKHKWEEEDADS